MRIPSQFNEDSLYRRQKSRSRLSKDYRQLIRLVLGLLIVVVVMQQAAKPLIYEPFFSDRQTDVDSGSSTWPNHSPPSVGDVLSQTEQNKLPTEGILQAPAPPPFVPDAAIQADARAFVANIPVADQLDFLILQVQRQRGGTSDVATDTMIDSLQGLIRSRVVDGSVWHAKDRDALLMYLDEGAHLTTFRFPRVGVLPLLQQPDVYRNQMVSLSGRVAKCEQIELAKRPTEKGPDTLQRSPSTNEIDSHSKSPSALQMTSQPPDNPLGITRYWHLWLRPNDGTDRPVLAIVQHVPESIRELGSDASISNGPRVTVAGRFLKRLAYRSSIGADVTPVIVGGLVPSSNDDDQVDSAIAANGPAFDHWLWITLAFAAGLGLSLAFLAFWRNSSAAKRSRRLRRESDTIPVDFL